MGDDRGHILNSTSKILPTEIIFLVNLSLRRNKKPQLRKDRAAVDLVVSPCIQIIQSCQPPSHRRK